MDALRPVLRVGLTGGIASGKTTVAGFLSELGAFVLDADQIAHEVMDPGGSAYHEVIAHFGPEILDEGGHIRRPVLAARVFGDNASLEALNGIVHPRVMDEAERRLRHYQGKGHGSVVVLDAALLVESGLYRSFRRLVVVRCRRESQLQRLLARKGLDADHALARIEAQAPLEAKLAVADYTIDTDTTLKVTRKQTEQIYGSLLADFARDFGEPGARTEKGTGDSFR